MSLIESLPRVRSLRLPRADGLIPWVVPSAIFAIWQLACITGFVSGRVLPAPSDVALAGWRNDPKVSDNDFVIAAYQASQVFGFNNLVNGEVSEANKDQALQNTLTGQFKNQSV